MKTHQQESLHTLGHLVVTAANIVQTTEYQLPICGDMMSVKVTQGSHWTIQ